MTWDRRKWTSPWWVTNPQRMCMKGGNITNIMKWTWWMCVARKSIPKRRINRKTRGRGWASCWGWVKLINKRATRRRWVKESMIMMITNNSNNTTTNTNIYNNSRRWDLLKWTNPWWATSPNRLNTTNSSSNNSSSFNTTNPTTNSEATWSNCHYLQLTPNPSTTTSSHKLDKSRSTGCYPPPKSPKTILISLMRYYNKGWTSPWWVMSRKLVRSRRRTIGEVRMDNNSRKTTKGTITISWSITWWQCPGYRNWTRRRMRSII